MSLPPAKDFREAFTWVEWTHFSGPMEITIEWPRGLQLLMGPKIRIRGRLDARLTRSAHVRVQGVFGINVISNFLILQRLP
jgi:hypothetical protein